MTQEEKRIKLAEAAGWTPTPWGAWTQARSGIPSTECPSHAELPDYFNDLNAVHELEKELTKDQQSTFAYKLNMLHPTADITYPDPDMSGYRKELFAEAFDLMHATAAQRAEAIGLTLNLWKQ